MCAYHKQMYTKFHLSNTAQISFTLLFFCPLPKYRYTSYVFHTVLALILHELSVERGLEIVFSLFLCLFSVES